MKKTTKTPAKTAAKSTGKNPTHKNKAKAAYPKKPNTPKTAPKKSPVKKPAGKKAVTKKPVQKATLLKKPLANKTAEARANKKIPTAATNRETNMATVIHKALDDMKGKEIVSLDVHHLTDVMDIMMVVSGTSNRHVKSLADSAMLAMKKAGYRHYGMEGGDAGEWVLVDFGGVVLHVMQPHIREFYDLERLWSTPRATDA